MFHASANVVRIDPLSTTAQYWLNLQRNVDLWDSLELNRESIENVEPLPLVAAG